MVAGSLGKKKIVVLLNQPGISHFLFPPASPSLNSGEPNTGNGNQAQTARTPEERSGFIPKSKHGDFYCSEETEEITWVCVCFS